MFPRRFTAIEANLKRRVTMSCVEFLLRLQQKLTLLLQLRGAFVLAAAGELLMGTHEPDPMLTVFEFAGFTYSRILFLNTHLVSLQIQIQSRLGNDTPTNSQTC